MQSYDLRNLQRNIKEIKKNNFIFIQGEDHYLIEESLRVLKGALKEEESSLNWQTHYSDEMNLDSILEGLKSYSFFGDIQVSVIKNASHLKEVQWVKLTELLDIQDLGHYLILVSNKFDKRKKTFKTFSKKSCFIDLKTPYENKIPDWIRYMCKQLHLQLSSKGIFLVQRVCGSQLSDIYNELLKLQQIIGLSKVKDNDIEYYLTHSRTENIFKLMEIVGNRNLTQAFLYLDRLLKAGHSGLEILGLMLRHFRILTSIKRGLEEGLSSHELSVKTGVHPFFINSYLKQAKMWSVKGIKGVIFSLYELDKQLKSSYGMSHLYWQQCLLKMCQS